MVSGQFTHAWLAGGWQATARRETRYFCVTYSYTDLNAEVDSMTARPDTDGSSDGFSVLVIMVPVSAAGTLLVITISVLLTVFLKRRSKLFLQVSIINPRRACEGYSCLFVCLCVDAYISGTTGYGGLLAIPAASELLRVCTLVPSAGMRSEDTVVCLSLCVCLLLYISLHGCSFVSQRIRPT